MINYFAAYLISTYDVSVGFVALPLAIAATGQVIGSYSAGLVAKRRDRAVLIAATSAVGGACGLLFFAVDLDLWVTVAVGTVGTGLLSVAMPTLVAASTEFSGESKATGAGLMGLSNQAGGGLRGGLVRAVAGQHRLRGCRLPVPGRENRKRPDGGTVRAAVAPARRLNRREKGGGSASRHNYRAILTCSAR